MGKRLENVKFDPHTHGPWVYWKPEAQGLLLRKTRTKIVQALCPPRNLSGLLGVYIPKIKYSHVAIALCNLTLDRYEGITQELEDKREQAKIKREYGLRDVDISAREFFTGFQGQNDNWFYMIRGQEPHLADGHVSIFPLGKVLDYRNPNGNARSLDEVLGVAEKEEISPIVIATHPCMGLGVVENLGLWALNELSGSNLSMSEGRLLKLIIDKKIHGVEVYNAAAKPEHNRNMKNIAGALAKMYNLPCVVGSDAYSEELALAAYNRMDIDFSNPEAMCESIKDELKRGNYSTHKKVIGSKPTLKMLLENALMWDRHRDYE